MTTVPMVIFLRLQMSQQKERGTLEKKQETSVPLLIFLPSSVVFKDEDVFIAFKCYF
jgi:hypothetical protein